jgi:methylated-DNA-[protein]-cysteine S-methyltransferase
MLRHYFIFETTAGFCAVAWSEVGITRFQLPSRSAATTERNLSRRLPGASKAAPTAEVTWVIGNVKRYFEGHPVDFSNVALDLADHGEFFDQVYAAVRRIGWGHTTTYGALAKELGAGPEFARDVGQAMAKNPVPLIIPCHRVLAAGGQVGGFSAPGGSTAKIHMLHLEGIRVGPAQQSLGF